MKSSKEFQYKVYIKFNFIVGIELHLHIGLTYTVQCISFVISLQWNKEVLVTACMNVTRDHTQPCDLIMNFFLVLTSNYSLVMLNQNN